MPRKARENTLASFALAIAAGADALELDVHGTRDGMVVVHHDPHLPPAVGHAGDDPGTAIAALTFADIQDRRSGDESVPSLGEVVDLAAGRVGLYVEVKAPGIERAVIDELRRAEGRVAVHSFDHRVARRVHALASDLPTGLLSSSYLLAPDRILTEALARDYWQWWEMIDAPLVDAIHRAGGRVIAWTANSGSAVTRLAALDVDAICTDVADDVRTMLATVGQRG